MISLTAIPQLWRQRDAVNETVCIISPDLMMASVLNLNHNWRMAVRHSKIVLQVKQWLRQRTRL